MSLSPLLLSDQEETTAHRREGPLARYGGVQKSDLGLWEAERLTSPCQGPP